MTEVTRIEPGGRAVLFAFDDRSIPWRYRLRLEMHRPEKYDGNPVIARGPSGAADERRAENSPVIHDGERFRMWYIARDDGAGETAPGERERYNTSRGGRGGISEIGTTGDIVHSYDTGRICCAESDDGYHWHKPDWGSSNTAAAPTTISATSSPAPGRWTSCSSPTPRLRGAT